MAVHDIVTGSNGEKFLDGVTKFDWPDDTAAANMFSWTGQEATGPNTQLAAETAEASGKFLGTHDNELLSLPGGRLGDVNPHLTEAFAQGLAPYVNNIAGTHGAVGGEFFQRLDNPTDIDNGRMPVAKGVFSVLSSDPTASDIFNGAALRESVLAEGRYAQDYRSFVPGLDSYQSPLHDAATLQALSNVGIHNATDATDWNDARKEAMSFEQERRAFQTGVAALGAVPGVGPGFEVLGAASESAIIGDPMSGSWGDDQNPIPQMDNAYASRQILDSLVGSGVLVNNLPREHYTPIDPGNPSGPQRIRTFEEMQDVDQYLPDGDYKATLDRALDTTIGTDFSNAAAGSMSERYNKIIDDLDPT